MIRALFAPLCLSLCSLPALAVADACDDPTTTLDMRLCAAKQLQQADNALNAAYALAKDAAAEADALHGEAADSGAQHHLLAAQRSWIKLRDADCALAGFAARGGTLEPLLVTGCLTDLTEKRTIELHNIARDLRQ